MRADAPPRRQPRACEGCLQTGLTSCALYSIFGSKDALVRALGTPQRGLIPAARPRADAWLNVEATILPRPAERETRIPDRTGAWTHPTASLCCAVDINGAFGTESTPADRRRDLALLHCDAGDAGPALDPRPSSMIPDTSFAPCGRTQRL